jgi:aspartyl/glutamyl-tRNA(Asn/Gln) amidotransferase C subunit
MSDKITKDVFDRLAELAALALQPEEANYLHQQLNNQLSAIDQLLAVPLDNETPVAAHGVPYTADNSQPIRGDKADPYKEPDAILSQAPEVSERSIVVQDIPHEGLD